LKYNVFVGGLSKSGRVGGPACPPGRTGHRAPPVPTRAGPLGIAPMPVRLECRLRRAVDAAGRRPVAAQGAPGASIQDP